MMEDMDAGNGAEKMKVLVVDDDPQMQLAIKATLDRAGYEVTVANNGRMGLELAEKGGFELIISDQRMPEMGGAELLAALQERKSSVPFIMITAHGTISQAVEAMQKGAADFLAKPFSAEDLERIVERVLNPETKLFRSRMKKQKTSRPIVTNDSIMIRVLEVAEAVARSDATVLIQGESGTGKELVARLLHGSSPRAQQPFVAVNCAALPSNLLESELFGHEKGAFTGALNRKIGKFELAHGGTILLDEISEMELALQAKLLRVLQEREVDRVGGKDPVSVDVRVLATTNRDLEEMVNNGKFRADLYYRLNVIPLTLPALRHRRGDVRLLAEHFMARTLGKDAPELPAEVLMALEAHGWPGNVRELQNAVERAAILAQGGVPRKSDFMLGAGVGGAAGAASRPTLASQIEIERVATTMGAPGAVSGSEALMIRSGMTVAEMEKALILETLRCTGYNRTQASKLLGISIRTLRNKLHEYRAAGAEVGTESTAEDQA
jgi:DNA-binding NtrC family response regulator